MATLEAEVFDIGCASLADPQTVQAEQHRQRGVGPVEMPPKASAPAERRWPCVTDVPKGVTLPAVRDALGSEAKRVADCAGLRSSTGRHLDRSRVLRCDR
jgi:hypothetical protein